MTPPSSTASSESSVSSWSPIAKRTVASVSLGLAFYSMGWGLTIAAVANRVNDIGDKAILLGLLGLVEFIPVASLVLVTGSIADRRDRKVTVLVSQAAAIVVMLGLFVNASGTDDRLWPYYLGAFCAGIVRALMSPSNRPMIPAAVTPAQIPRAMSFYSASWQVAFAFGPLLFFTYGIAPKWSFLCGAGLATLGLLATSFIPRSVGRAHLANVPPERPTFEQAIQGLTVIRSHPILLGAIALDLAAVLFGGAIALLPRLSKNELNLDAWDQGLLRSAGGIGAVVVGLILTQIPITRHIGRTLLIVVALFGLFTILLGLAPSLWVACLAHAGLMAADSVSVFIRSTLVPLVTPPDQQGRVSAVENVFIGASNELGAAESGVAGHFLGTRGGIVSGGLLTILVVALWMKMFPAISKLDRFADAHRQTARASEPAS